MGKEEIEALIRILEAENTRGLSSLVLGTWSSLTNFLVW